MKQQTFIKENKGTVIINHSSEQRKPAQSKETILNARFEGDDVTRVSDFVFEHEMTKSELVRNSVFLYMKIYPFLKRQSDKGNGTLDNLISWLNNMP